MIKVRGWRLCRAEDSQGMLMWFDPFHEQPLLRALTRDEKSVRLDEHGSVSGLDEDEVSAVPMGSQLQLPLTHPG